MNNNRQINIDREKIENIIIYTLEGELVISNNTEFNNMIDKDIEGGNRKLIIDMKNLTFMDSSSVGILSKILKNDCIMKLVIDDSNENIKSLIELIIMHFDKTGYFLDREKAISSLMEEN